MVTTQLSPQRQDIVNVDFRDLATRFQQMEAAQATNAERFDQMTTFLNILVNNSTNATTITSPNCTYTEISHAPTLATSPSDRFQPDITHLQP